MTDAHRNTLAQVGTGCGSDSSIVVAVSIARRIASEMTSRHRLAQDGTGISKSKEIARARTHTHARTQVWLLSPGTCSNLCHHARPRE